MFQPDAFLEALPLVFTIDTLFWLAVGVTVGVGVGAIPGMSAITGIALLLPLTFTMNTAAALGLLIGLYKGAVYGGSISAISFATPGTPEAAATVYDGFKMMKAGKGRKALLMALYASVTGDFLSTVLTIVIAPLLAAVALNFGPSERFWLIVLAITLLGSLTGSHLAKGMLSAGIGLFIATIGTDPIGGVPRNTFGVWWLSDGIHLVPLVIGTFAMGRMMEEAVRLLQQHGKAEDLRRSVAGAFTTAGEGLRLREYLSTWKELLIGTGLGTFVGILPGLGSTVGAFLAYGVARQVSPHRKIGSGVIHGIAAPEAGNNATVGPALVPLLAFGIPGSGTAALIGSALIMQGATPSPRMFELYPAVVYSLFIILIIGNAFNLVIGRAFALVYAKLGELPQPILIPTVMALAVAGSYGFRSNPYDVVVMLTFGVLAFGMGIFRIPAAPMVITFLIAPMAEANLRRTLLINEADWMRALFDSHLAIGLAVAAVALSILFARLRLVNRVTEMARRGADGPAVDD